VNRVETLKAEVGIKNLPQMIRHPFKYGLVEVVFAHDVADAPDALRARISVFVGIAGDVQGIMPLDIERELVDGLFIGEIVHLLENHGTHHGDQFIGRTSRIVTEMPGEQIYREDCPNVITEHSRPGVVQQLFSLRPQLAKGVEHVAGFVVFDAYHSISS
jgi:hypothetical protein